jgi:hypothetical protein
MLHGIVRYQSAGHGYATSFGFCAAYSHQNITAHIPMMFPLTLIYQQCIAKNTVDIQHICVGIKNLKYAFLYLHSILETSNIFNNQYKKMKFLTAV